MNIQNIRVNARLWFCVSRHNLLYINEYYGLAGMKEYQPIIGVSHIPEFFKSRPSLKILFIFGVSFFLFIRLIKKVVEALIRKIHIKNIGFDGNILYLSWDNNSFLPRLLENAGILDEKAYWLCWNASSIHNIKTDKKIDALSVLSYHQIFWCFVDSIRAYFLILSRYGYLRVLMSNGAFDWFIYYWTLQNIKPDVKLFFCKQYDPLTICIGRSPQQNKVFLQHGTLVIKNNTRNIPYPILQKVVGKDCYTVNSPYKLSNISAAYCFSETEYEAACESIFYGRPKPIIVGYGLKETDLIKVDSEKSVLIVGFYPSYKDKEERLLSELSKYEIKVFLKNHPGVPPMLYNDLRSKYKFIFINDSVFPKTSIVLSYGSTLALEYEELGVNVLYYDARPVNDIIGDVKELLKL